MSGPGVKLGAVQPKSAVGGESGVLSQLLHALNQPLTGLQCSLELALAAPRRAEEYIGTIGEALRLTSRMRVLVEALRDLTGAGTNVGASDFLLDRIVSEAVGEFRPLSEAKGVRLVSSVSGPLPVHADYRSVRTAMFRLLDSLLSLTKEDAELRVEARMDTGFGSIAICWEPGAKPEFSPFSQPELGLLIAQAEWEQAGGRWIQPVISGRETRVLSMPLPCDPPRNRSEKGAKP